jgi:cytoskeletal protein RodZ
MAANPRKRFMLLILLEALLALVLLLAIVWWTMFSGRKGGEPPLDTDPAASPENGPKAPFSEEK